MFWGCELDARIFKVVETLHFLFIGDVRPVLRVNIEIVPYAALVTGE